ncbi:MAG: hypothetical protein FWD22_04435 [Treponema sp.]|nr:hypothetical protein [Treponema sp.]
MQQKSLNKLYTEYLLGDLERAEFEGNIYTYLVKNKEKTCISHWGQDEYEDFISWFYPRLRRSIDSYQEIGASFEAFMNKYLLLSSKEFHVRTTTKSITEYSAWSARVPEMYAFEEPPAYIHNNTEQVLNQLMIDKKGRKNTKRVLALILKCYCYISEDFAEKVAPMIGMNKKELIFLLAKIKKMRQKKDDEIYLMKERVYCQFYRCLIYERRLTIVNENTEAHNKLLARLEKARNRLDKMRKRIAGVRTDATNQQVADVIGITKGTVDASLHRLKSKWEEMAEKADLN